jgi:hypothetical protein
MPVDVLADRVPESTNGRARIVGEWAALLQAIALIALLTLVGGLYVGFPGLLFSAAFVGGLMLWLLLFRGRPLDHARLLPSYLLTVALFIAHVGEEYVGHMEVVLSRLSGFAVSQTAFLAIAAFAAPAIWVLGGVLLAAGKSLGRFILSTFYFGMIGGELSHLAFPFMIDGRFHYVAGMATAPLLVAAAAYSLWRARWPQSS